MPAPPAARPGSIEVITGSMFSGKSEELIRRVRRVQIARQKVQLFKPRLDARYSEAEIVSHSEMKMPSQVVETEPGIKGASVSNVGKPAKMETGLVVQVPAFINEGDVIRIDTATGSYVERVNK